MKLKVLLITLCVVPLALFAQDKKLFQKEYFVVNKETLPLRILYPERFDKNVKYPLVIFLHGRGESGNDNEKQLLHGSSLFLDSKNRVAFPAIVVFPQCAADSYWANVKIKTDEQGKRHFLFRKGGKPTKSMSLLSKYFDSIKQEQYIDPDRIYIMGLSMGGMGTLEMLRRKPDEIAAAVAICGGDNISKVRKYAHKVKLWVFHGEKDDIVSPIFSENIVAELKKQGANPRFTIYPNANHNSWDSAFAEKDLLFWLFNQQKGD
ncbi:prolyl oligopeptidase family serine peptidase [Pseudopedobacter beijingensis]|uniref:Prolyl oligopeptidase family serine peptidase n=1 Tax=Pseudopedobacter beijingensis TaxID=1207056 RepID=A0ABW4IG20_9SPHI